MYVLLLATYESKELHVFFAIHAASCSSSSLHCAPGTEAFHPPEAPPAADPPDPSGDTTLELCRKASKTDGKGSYDMVLLPVNRLLKLTF